MNDLREESERTFYRSQVKRERPFENFLRFRKRAVGRAILLRACGAHGVVPHPARGFSGARSEAALYSEAPIGPVLALGLDESIVAAHVNRGGGVEYVSSRQEQLRARRHFIAPTRGEHVSRLPIGRR